MSTTSTDIQRSDFNNLSNTINYAINKKLLNLNTSMVCRFIQYDMVGDVKYGEVEQVINNIDINKNPLPKPIIFQVPITYIMGGNAGIEIEYKKDDSVLVVFSQQSLTDIKLIWNNDQTIPEKGIQPTNYGKFLLQDAIIVGKISAKPPLIKIKITENGIDIDSNNKPINVNSGTADTNISCKNAIINADAKIELTASSEIDLTAPSIKLNGAVSCDSTLEATTSVATAIVVASTGATIAGLDYSQHGHTPGTYTNSGGPVTGKSGGVG